MTSEPPPESSNQELAMRLRLQGLESEKSNDLAEAEECYRKALVLTPRSMPLHLFLGNLIGKTPARRREGIRVIRRGLEFHPDHPALLSALGMLLFDAQQWAEAEQALSKSVSLEPNPAKCCFLAACLSALDRGEEAIAYDRKALELDPKYDESMSNLGRRLRFQDPLEAERLLRRTIELDPEVHNYWCELGHVLLVQDRSEEAIEALEHAVALHGEYLWSSLRLAIALVRAGRLSEAVEPLTVALRLRHDENTREHEDCLSSALASEGEAPWGKLYRAFLLGLGKRFDEALDVLEGAPGEEPFTMLECALRADRVQDLGREAGYAECREALALLEEEASRGPADPGVLEALGRAHHRAACRLADLGEGDEAVIGDHRSRARDALERAVQLDPSRAFTYSYLGLACEESGDLDAAEAAYRRGFELGDQGVHGAYLGILLAGVGRFEEAEEILARIIGDYPECGLAWRWYGLTLIHAGRPDRDANVHRAVAAYERCVEVDPEVAENHYRLGDVLANVSLPRAIAHLERCLELDPEHRRAPGRLAELRGE